MKKLSAILFFPSFLFANSYIIEISQDKLAPTVEQIVQPINSSSAEPPPLQTLLENSPTKISYLVPVRPVGNLKKIIQDNPKWSLSKLYQRVVFEYPSPLTKASIEGSLSNDENIAGFQPVSDIEIINGKSLVTSKEAVHATRMFQDAWELSEGMGYVGIADSGIQISHEAFRAFNSNGSYNGGNLLEGFQYDIQEKDFNIDEKQPYRINNADSACDETDGNPNDSMIAEKNVGHGTHVSGIIAGKSNSFNGICKNCGLTMVKIIGMKGASCRNGKISREGLTFPNFVGSWVLLPNTGIGTLNVSFGYDPDEGIKQHCDQSSVECDALSYLEKQQIMMVGASGNHRTTLQFPASDTRVIAVGGLDKNNSFWDYYPNCPSVGNRECGSNFSGGQIFKTDVVTPATNVFSTFYKGAVWNTEANCTDASDGIPNDGYGLCTGTSMSAPQVTAMVHLMRSANPLLPNGTQEPKNLIGIRNVLNATASRANNWDSKLGYGIPNPKKALETILGVSNGKQMKTRLTPMFEMKTVGSNGVAFYKNNIYTPFPQVASAFLFHNGIGYRSNPSAPAVKSFTQFWYDHEKLSNFDGDLTPKASFYVFTTNNNPFTNSKNMTPLRRMTKNAGGGDRNDSYVINTSEIESFHNNGYQYAGIEGYILPKCSPIASCKPRGSTPLYRNEADSNNHVLVASNNRPNNQSTLLGFVYLNKDSDNDGLIDGQEIILGTDINKVDSDNDGVNDGVEYPPAGVPVSDPMELDAKIFKDSFEQ